MAGCTASGRMTPTAPHDGHFPSTAQAFRIASAFFVASIFTPWAVPVFALPIAVTLIGWFWPRPHPPTPHDDRSAARLREARA